MKLTNRRISVGVSKKINLGNYESLQLHAGQSADVADTDDRKEAYSILWDECLEEVMELEDELKPNKDRKRKRG